MEKKLSPIAISEEKLARIRLAPMTGAIENIGYETEESFYFDIVEAIAEAGLSLSIGDGCPDIKLESGIRAVKKIRERYFDKKAAVFIKPYENKRVFERIEKSASVAESIGIDIDSYNIVTMRNLVNLEKKKAKDLIEIKRHIRVPFSIKGIFNVEEIELVKEVLPDIVVISNHGGRVENRIGSTADFLAEYGKELKKYCGEVWVDGGLRCYNDIAIASALGATEVMIGRPFASALCAGGKQEVLSLTKRLKTR